MGSNKVAFKDLSEAVIAKPIIGYFGKEYVWNSKYRNKRFPPKQTEFIVFKMTQILSISNLFKTLICIFF